MPDIERPKVNDEPVIVIGHEDLEEMRNDPVIQERLRRAQQIAERFHVRTSDELTDLERRQS
jgi:hypothetical protein